MAQFESKLASTKTTADDTAPAVGAFLITPSDTVDHRPVRSLYTSESGTISFITMDGNLVENFPIVNAGQYHPLQTYRVRATGTSAGQIWGLY